MRLSTVPAATAFLSVLSLAATLPAIADDTPSTTATVSQVRIVRLSEVRGMVQVDRAIGRGFEPAIANLPIVEQSKIQTDIGIAEIEFEDNSTLRMAPNSVVEIPQLERTATATLSTIRLVKGTAYVSLMKSRTDKFTILFGNRSLELPPATHMRLEVTQDRARLALLHGTLRIEDISGATEVKKKKTVTFDLKDQKHPEIAQKITAEPLDDWDKRAAAYHAGTAAFAGFNSPYAYGVRDMAYYGAFIAAPCGRMWRPYFVSAAWDPYSNGAWAWFASSGYSWVAPYPWGWTAYHYGSWMFCPGIGWGWHPQGSWTGLQNVTTTVCTPPIVPHKPVPVAIIGKVTVPLKPIDPPRPGGRSVLAVNTTPLVRSDIVSSSSFQFRRDSAGVGIPRETFGKLSKFSEHAVSNGVASTRIYVVSPGSTWAPARGVSAGVMTGATMHRGYAQPASSAPRQLGFAGGTHGGSSSVSPRSSTPASSPHASAPSAAGVGSRR